MVVRLWFGKQCEDAVINVKTGKGVFPTAVGHCGPRRRFRLTFPSSPATLAA
jgi:hypothetical protein